MRHALEIAGINDIVLVSLLLTLTPAQKEPIVPTGTINNPFTTAKPVDCLKSTPQVKCH